jgi:hypothetical protein
MRKLSTLKVKGVEEKKIEEKQVLSLGKTYFSSCLLLLLL